MRLELLRGRVMIRPIEPDKSHGGIIIPDPQKRTNANTLGRGIVLAMGPPALTPRHWRRRADPKELACPTCGAMSGGWACGEDHTDPICPARGWEWVGGVEIPPAFKIGDEVLHIGQHVSRDSWNDGERVRYCSQEEVQAVIER